MNRRNFFKTLFSGAVAVVAAPLVGQVSKAIPGKAVLTPFVAGETIVGTGMTTLRPMVGEINELASQTNHSMKIGLPYGKESLETAMSFYEWMQEIVWEGIGC